MTDLVVDNVQSEVLRRTETRAAAEAGGARRSPEAAGIRAAGLAQLVQERTANLTDPRVVRAQQLLLEGHSVTSAAHGSGLGSDETLRRAFARHLGTTPSEYRARFATTGTRTVP